MSLGEFCEFSQQQTLRKNWAWKKTHSYRWEVHEIVAMHVLIANTTWVIIEELKSQNWTCTFIHQEIPNLWSLQFISHSHAGMDTQISRNFDKPFMSVCSSMSFMDIWQTFHVRLQLNVFHGHLTNLSCPSAAQCLSFSQTHKADMLLVESMNSFPVFMRARLRCHSSSLDSHCEQRLRGWPCFIRYW